MEHRIRGVANIHSFHIGLIGFEVCNNRAFGIPDIDLPTCYVKMAAIQRQCFCHTRNRVFRCRITN